MCIYGYNQWYNHTYNLHWFTDAKTFDQMKIIIIFGLTLITENFFLWFFIVRSFVRSMLLPSSWSSMVVSSIKTLSSIINHFDRIFNSRALSVYFFVRSFVDVSYSFEFFYSFISLPHQKSLANHTRVLFCCCSA